MMERATGAAALTRRGMAWQVFAYLGGMAAYAVHLLGGSALVPLSCELGTTLPLSALNLAAVAVAALAALAAWRIWRTAGPEAERTGSTPSQRSAFLGLAGLMLNVLAILVVLFAEVHVWFLDPCLPG